MNTKERIKTAFQHEKPDRAPVHADFTPEVTRKLLDCFNTDDYYEMVVKLGNDMMMVLTGIWTSLYGPKNQNTDDFDYLEMFRKRDRQYTEISGESLKRI
jgi:hypothetical protein